MAVTTEAPVTYVEAQLRRRRRLLLPILILLALAVVIGLIAVGFALAAAERRRGRAVEAGQAHPRHPGSGGKSRSYRAASVAVRRHTPDARRLHRAALPPAAVPGGAGAMGAWQA